MNKEHTSHSWPSLFLLLLLTFCLPIAGRASDERFSLDGAWMQGTTDSEGGSMLHIYNPDSTLYVCRLVVGPYGQTIIPSLRSVYSLISKGEGQYLYLEDGEPRPLTVTSDSTITIQRLGTRYTLMRDKMLTPRRVNEIRHIMASADLDTDTPTHYVFSEAEEELREENSTLEIMVAGALAALFVVGLVARSAHKRRKRVEHQLRQLMTEREHRPQILDEALKSVERDFFASNHYTSLCKRIATGKLTAEDWDEIELRLGQIYPGFMGKLAGLYRMSVVEQRVCLLLKLRVSPTDIATVLCREPSSISSIRSRLYHKVFRRKGGAKDWDEFILSL